MSLFVVVVGVSGVGKSTLLHELGELDARFTRIRPYVTRPLRPGETEKQSITDQEMDELFRINQLIAVNHVYGARYATPIAPIHEALARGLFPTADWMVEKLDIIRYHFDRSAFVVYLAPPPLSILRQRLEHTGRDPDGSRLARCLEDARIHETGAFNSQFDLRVPYTNDHPEDVATYVHARILESA